MNTKELLEQVAIAQGMKAIWVEELQSMVIDGVKWNPLDNNQDAIELASQIGAHDCITWDGKGLQGINGETDRERVAQVRQAIVATAIRYPRAIDIYS